MQTFSYRELDVISGEDRESILSWQRGVLCVCDVCSSSVGLGILMGARAAPLVVPVLI